MVLYTGSFRDMGFCFGYGLLYSLDMRNNNNITNHVLILNIVTTSRLTVVSRAAK